MAKSKTKSTSKLNSNKKPSVLGKLHFLSFKNLIAIAFVMVIATGGLIYTGAGSAAGCRVYPVSVTTADPGPWVTVPSWSTCRDVNIGLSAMQDTDSESIRPCGYFRVQYTNGSTSSNTGITCKGSGLKVLDYDIPNGTKYRIINTHPSGNRYKFNIYD